MVIVAALKNKKDLKVSCITFFLIGVQLLYNIVLASVVQCIESVMYIHTPPPS